eukprot:3752951-Amphidinium_carterae.1
MEAWAETLGSATGLAAQQRGSAAQFLHTFVLHENVIAATRRPSVPTSKSSPHTCTSANATNTAPRSTASKHFLGQ